MATTRPRPADVRDVTDRECTGGARVGGSGNANCTERAVQLHGSCGGPSEAGSVHLHETRRALGRDRRIRLHLAHHARNAPCTWTIPRRRPPERLRALARNAPCTCTLHAVHLHASRRALGIPPLDSAPCAATASTSIAIVLFAVLGRRNHDEGTAVTGVLVVAWPFLAGWTIAWFATRLHRRPRVRGGRAPRPRRRDPDRPALRVATDRGIAPAFIVVAVRVPRAGAGRPAVRWWRWSAARRARAAVYGMSSSLPPARRSTMRACASLTSSSGSSVVATACSWPGGEQLQHLRRLRRQLGGVRAEPAVAEDPRRSCGRSRRTRC